MPTAHPDRQVVRDLVVRVQPFDDQEKVDQQRILHWIDSGAQLFRTMKPATPPQHLAVYAALIDDATKTLMLVDHIKADAWLMPGGHVDDNEDPRACVIRELNEELHIHPDFHPTFGSDPLFLTVTQTRPPHTHTDVTLWFVFSAEQNQPVVPDASEFSQVRWFSLDHAAEWVGDFDPHLLRFLAKLSAVQGNCTRINAEMPA